MMGHGKHCDCMICSMGKAVGMIKRCNDKYCTNPKHKKEEKDQDQKK